MRTLRAAAVLVVVGLLGIGCGTGSDREPGQLLATDACDAPVERQEVAEVADVAFRPGAVIGSSATPPDASGRPTFTFELDDPSEDSLVVKVLWVLRVPPGSPVELRADQEGRAIQWQEPGEAPIDVLAMPTQPFGPDGPQEWSQLPSNLVVPGSGCVTLSGTVAGAPVAPPPGVWVEVDATA